MIALPGYIDKEAWEGFEEMRKLIKKPMTDRARKLIVFELDRIKRAGHDPNAALDQSTNKCWADVYQPQEKKIDVAPTNDYDKTRAHLEEQERHARLVEQQRLRRVS